MNNETPANTDRFTIDEEFKGLLPPLNSEDFEQLEKSIVEDGCRDALIVWKEEKILIDGHHRHAICKKHNRKYKIEEKSFANRDAAITWMLEHQKSRRNMNKFQWAEVILKLKPAFAAKAKANQRAGGGAVRTKSDKPVKTYKELAKLARMSPSTLQQVAYILKHADQTTLNRLRKGDAHYSINGVSEELRELIDKKTTKKSIRTNAKHRNSKSASPRPIPKAGTEPPNDITEHIIATLEELEQQYPQLPDRIDFYNTVDKWLTDKKRELILSEL